MKMHGLFRLCIAASALLVSSFACAGYDIIASRPSVSATDQTAHTQYPIVLVHGIAGAAIRFGVSESWYQIPVYLARHGAQVYVADVAAFNSELVRGEQLRAQVQRVLDVTGAPKVNLIGHSQGGFDARYVATIMPAQVASITTIGSPHKGTELLEYAETDMGRFLVKLAAPIANFVGTLMSWFNDANYEQDVEKPLKLMTPAGAAAFTRDFPTAGLSSQRCGYGQEQDVRDGYVQKLYSWTGNYYYRPFDFSNLKMPSFIDLVLSVSGTMIKLKEGGENDGAVPVCSALFGKVLGTYKWDHLNETNGVAGRLQIGSPDPRAVIYAHLIRLVNNNL
ncbi:triacylglycerol lipase [Mycoavidus sp. B2-EB]|uniref:esterase/lipase family protein n=1 Tax=Mycoavidus sp. B2-EB TaxID=2651972 RepID=UPI001E528086|nr:triacylglycerol lipase [Mycoavidus sp. B2-EB]BBO60079.1 lipase precursor [Mycoavidus sp. B2-EB]